MAHRKSFLLSYNANLMDSSRILKKLTQQRDALSTPILRSKNKTAKWISP